MNVTLKTMSFGCIKTSKKTRNWNKLLCQNGSYISQCKIMYLNSLKMFKFTFYENDKIVTKIYDVLKLNFFVCVI